VNPDIYIANYSNRFSFDFSSKLLAGLDTDLLTCLNLVNVVVDRDTEERCGAVVA
jgi:hypothetical protein